MSIGNKPVNPFEDNRAEYTHEGLTYREWLIGMLASNPATAYWYEGNDNHKYVDRDTTVLSIIAQADAIINQLDKEVKE